MHMSPEEVPMSHLCWPVVALRIPVGHYFTLHGRVFRNVGPKHLDFVIGPKPNVQGMIEEFYQMSPAELHEEAVSPIAEPWSQDLEPGRVLNIESWWVLVAQGGPSRLLIEAWTVQTTAPANRGRAAIVAPHDPLPTPGRNGVVQESR